MSFVLINSVLLNLLCVWIIRTLAIIFLSGFLFVCFSFFFQQHRGGMDTETRVSTESWPWRPIRKFSHHSCRDSNQGPFGYESKALTTELSLLLSNFENLASIHKLTHHFQMIIFLFCGDCLTHNYGLHQHLTMGEQEYLSGRALDSWTKGHRFTSWHGQLSVLNHFSIHSTPCYWSSM